MGYFACHGRKFSSIQRGNEEEEKVVGKAATQTESEKGHEDDEDDDEQACQLVVAHPVYPLPRAVFISSQE